MRQKVALVVKLSLSLSVSRMTEFSPVSTTRFASTVVIAGVSKAAALRLQGAAQDLAGRFGAVQRTQSPALDFPALLGADELPTIGRNAVHVEAARRAMIGNVEHRTDPVRHEDL